MFIDRVPRSAHVQLMVRVIEERSAEQVSIRMLANAVGRQEAYLGRLFRDQIGMTVHDYLTAVRMERAARLIAQGDKVEAVVLEVGYRSKKNFYRQFIRRFGMTPALYRRHDAQPEASARLDPHPGLRLRVIRQGARGERVVARSGVQPGLLYVGGEDGTVQVSRDGGATWTGGVCRDPANGRVVAIGCSVHAAATAYATCADTQPADDGARVYVTTDAGQSWWPIGADLPGGPAHVVREDPRRPHLVYAATRTGIFVSFDGGHAWTALQSHLPAAPVQDIVAPTGEQGIVVVTRGGGLWMLDDVVPLHEMHGRGGARSPSHRAEQRRDELAPLAEIECAAAASAAVLGQLRSQLRRLHERLLAAPGVTDVVRSTWTTTAHRVSELLRVIGPTLRHETPRTARSTLRARIHQLASSADDRGRPAGGSRPPDVERLQSELVDALDRVRAIVTHDIPMLNQLLEQHHLTPIPGVAPSAVPFESGSSGARAWHVGAVAGRMP